MSKSPPPIVYLLLVGAVGYGLWLGREPLGQMVSNRFPRSNQVSERAVGQTVIISRGETVLIGAGGANLSKSAGAALMALNLPAEAISVFETAVANDRNDPEALIYLNNARAQERGNPFTIAVVAPVSSDENSAKEILRGVAQAQEEWFRRWGEGPLLKVAIADDGNDPRRSVAVAEALAADPEVLAVVGHNASDASLAAAPIYQAAGLPMISPTSTSTQLSGLGEGIFRTVPSDQLSATQLARYTLNQVDQRRAAIFYNPGSAYSDSLRTAFTNTFATEGGQVVLEVDLTTPNFDGAEALQLAIARGANVIMLAPNVGTRDAALAVAAANAQQAGLPLLGGDSLYTFATLAQGQEAVAGMTLAVPWHVDAPLGQTFADSSSRLWGGQVSWRTALTYDATQALLQAISNPASPSRRATSLSLIDPSFTLVGASGPIEFLPSGDRSSAGVLVQIQPGNRSGTGFDFVYLTN